MNEHNWTYVNELDGCLYSLVFIELSDLWVYELTINNANDEVLFKERCKEEFKSDSEAKSAGIKRAKSLIEEGFSND